jgi:hypothetical protein
MSPQQHTTKTQNKITQTVYMGNLSIVRKQIILGKDIFVLIQH